MTTVAVAFRVPSLALCLPGSQRVTEGGHGKGRRATEARRAAKCRSRRSSDTVFNVIKPVKKGALSIDGSTLIRFG